MQDRIAVCVSVVPPDFVSMLRAKRKKKKQERERKGQGGRNQ